MGHSWAKGVRSFLALCAVHLSLYLCAYAESDQGKKKVTLIAEGMPRKEVFNRIEKQTGLRFFYSSGEIKLPDRYTVRMVDKTLDEVLGKLLLGSGLEWEYNENVVVIRVRKKVVTENVPVASDSSITSMAVSGKVTDENGQPIPGATVRIKRNSDGVTTDTEGNFTLPSTRRGDLLIISSIGYETRELSVKGKSIIVKLPIALQSLDETVIKGYYNTSNRLNTGNVSHLKAVDINKQPVGDPLAALSGRIPGLFIRQNSGVPGTLFTIRLRGQNSIANGNNPLFIVDGVPFSSNTLSNINLGPGAGFMSPLNSINPSDIERIDVLKDADATAIYGSRGANGVILITTKKGTINKSKFDVDVYAGFGQVTRKVNLLNTQQYLMMRREALKNDNLQVGDIDYDLNGAWDTARYTDWQKIFIGGTSSVKDAKFNFSGGSTETQFTVGGGYRNETTVFPGNYFDRKISIHAGINHTSSNNKFKAQFTASYVNDNNQMPTSDLTSYITLAPNSPALYKPDGSLNWQNSTWTNPFAELEKRGKVITNNLIGNFQFEYRLLAGLDFKSSFGFNRIDLKQNYLTPFSSANPAFADFSQYFRNNTYGTNVIQSWIIEPQLSYNRKLFGGNLNILTGITFQDQKQESLTLSASQFSSDALLENILAAPEVIITGNSYAIYRYNAIYGRIGYDINDKYIFNLTARRDGSSRFGPGKQFGNFGAVGVAWLFSKEQFMANLGIISFGKLRASYGSTGNDQLSAYQYLSTYTSLNYSYNGLNGLYPTRLANPKFGWETVKKLEVGLELGLLANRIMLTGSWYRNRTGNQLVGYSLPSTTGFASIQYNLPAVIQNSGLEFDVNTINTKGTDFSWNSNFNITVPRNKLIAFPNIEGSSYATTYEVGKSLLVSSRFVSTGIDPETGLYKFEDQDNDGIYTYANDRRFFSIEQDFFGALGNDFTYKNWQLSIFFQFVKQKGTNFYYNGTPGSFGEGKGNQPIDVLERWQSEKSLNPSLQKFTTNYNNEQTLFDNSNARISDASFARLKNLSLTWQAPADWVTTMHLRSLAVALQCQNLITITNYRGVDPESGGGMILPPIRMMTARIQIGL